VVRPVGIEPATNRIIDLFLFGYLHFFLVSFWVHDMDTVQKKITFVSFLYLFDLVLILVFGVVLGWL